MFAPVGVTEIVFLPNFRTRGLGLPLKKKFYHREREEREREERGRERERERERLCTHTSCEYSLRTLVHVDTFIALDLRIAPACV